VEDDWNPNPDCKDTILNKVMVNMNDQQIKRTKNKIANKPYDPTNVIEYAKGVKAKLDEED
jgi:hypothetical protein